MRPLSPHTLSSAPIWRENLDKSFAKAIVSYDVLTLICRYAVEQLLFNFKTNVCVLTNEHVITVVLFY